MTATRQATDPATTRRIACPRCSAPMRELMLSTHRPLPVTVDHCPDCRLVWFDALESVQLDGLGWVRLLREMEHGARRPLADAQVAHMACPTCAAPLRPVQNRSRFGLFSTLACPRQHGHLHSHSGVLAERGLVRPLGVAERKALAQEKHALHCLNCGGAAASGDDACSWCGTALVVLDLPRLAHSLRLRLDGMGPSPQGLGRHTAWACRGCGAALDPGRDTSCTHCGHLVVAFELPDIEPLLDVAEAELSAAAEAQARMLARLTSSRRARGAPLPDAQRRHPLSSPSWTRTLLLGGWSPLLALLTLALALILAAFTDLPWSRRTPLQALLAQPLGDDPGEALAWAEAHRLLAPGDETARRTLRRGLFDRVTRQLAGAPWPATATVGSVLAATAESTRGSEERWYAGLARHLQPQPAAADVALPEGAYTGSGRMEPVAPGVWIEAATRSEGLWVTRVKNTGPATLQVGTMSLRLMVAAPNVVPWRCEPIGRNRPLLRPGEELTLLCRTQVLVRLQEDLWAAAMQQIRAGTPLQIEWRDENLHELRGADRMLDRLIADAAVRSAPLDRFLRRHTELRRGTPPIVDTVAAQRPRPALRAQLQVRWEQLTGSERRTLGLATLLAAWVAYCAVTRCFGERRALVSMAVLVVPACVWLGRGEGAASVLLVGMYLVVTLGLAFVFTFASRLYGAAVFGRVG